MEQNYLGCSAFTIVFLRTGLTRRCNRAQSAIDLGLMTFETKKVYNLAENRYSTLEVLK